MPIDVNPLSILVKSIGEDERKLADRVSFGERSQWALDLQSAVLEVRLARLERHLHVMAWTLALVSVAGVLAALVAVAR